jgi:hypothetical protein
MLVAEYVQGNAAFVRSTPMFEQVNTLPGSEHRPAVDHGDRQLDLSERSSKVCRHIVGAFVVVVVEVRVFRCDSLEECFQIRTYFRRGVLLYEKRRRCVGTKDRHQSVGNGLVAHPGLHCARDIDQAAASRSNGQESGCLLHVDILDRITSAPRLAARPRTPRAGFDSGRNCLHAGL